MTRRCPSTLRVTSRGMYVDRQISGSRLWMDRNVVMTTPSRSDTAPDPGPIGEAATPS